MGTFMSLKTTSYSGGSLSDKSTPDLNFESLVYTELQLQQFLDDPKSVAQDWRDYFHQLVQEQDTKELEKSLAGPSIKPQSIFDPDGISTGPTTENFSTARMASIGSASLLDRISKQHEDNNNTRDPDLILKFAFAVLICLSPHYLTHS